MFVWLVAILADTSRTLAAGRVGGHPDAHADTGRVGHFERGAVWPRMVDLVSGCWNVLWNMGVEQTLRRISTIVRREQRIAERSSVIERGGHGYQVRTPLGPQPSVFESVRVSAVERDCKRHFTQR
jgi:hypothetical protein